VTSAEARTGAARAFVAGATGYTGREVVRALRARGVDAIAHVRPDTPALDDWRARFAALGARVDATPWDEGAITATLHRERPTHVFALLGTTRARAADPRRRSAVVDSYDAVDYGLTTLLLRAAVAAGSRPRFVYLSAIGATERTASAYLRVRGRIERELRESGLSWLSVRPSVVTGADRDEGRPVERLAAAVLDGVGTALGALGIRTARRWRSIDGPTLGDALVRLALEPGSASRIVERDELGT
jgi:uncharacterized protein YbjT (DUF2867 family)